MLVGVVGVGFFTRSLWLPEGVEGFSVSTRSAPPALTTDRPESGPLDGGPYAHVPERAADPLLAASPDDHLRDPGQATALLASARRALVDGDIILARAHFGEALNAGLPAKGELEARTELRKLGRQTIFSSSVVKGDPFTEHYVIVPGDSLHKIARRFDVTAEFLARINGIADMQRIQAGRRIKVVHGPFRARVSKSEHLLYVFCGETFIDHFKVGLGADDATPNGTWIVRDKLINPTYYPPRGGDIIAADDPKNPLGERWIGLEGIDGEAVGQTRYGIHGTIEPDSVGTDASMGCIRMYNEDVEFLFSLLIEEKSTVEIRD